MDEDIFMPIVVFSFILILVWMSINYYKWKLLHTQTPRQDSDNSLGMSDLKDLMREAVEEATGPLVERIEAMEAELRQANKPRLMPAQGDAYLEELDQAPAEQTALVERRT